MDAAEVSDMDLRGSNFPSGPINVDVFDWEQKLFQGFIDNYKAMALNSKKY